MLDKKLIQAEVNRIYRQNLAFMDLMPKPPPPPLPWHRRMWYRLRFRIGELRERLGEIVAGRRFDDY